MKKLLLVLLFSIVCLAQTISSPPGVQGVNATYFGQSGGSTARYYWVQAIYPFGRSPLSSSVTVTTIATLSSSSFVQISWNPAAGATGYDVLYTATSTAPSGACNCAVAVNTSAPTARHQGQTLSNYTVSTPGTVTGSSSSIYYAEVTIAAASVLTLRATPVTLVAAPGAGYVLQLLGGYVIMDYGMTAYTESADNLAVKYTNGSGAAASETIETTGFIDSTADDMITVIPIKDVAAVANAALVLHNTGDGEFGNMGDSPLRVKILYTIHATGL